MPKYLTMFAARLFARVGVLPWLLVIALIYFSLAADNFLTGENMFNIARQSIYLVLVSMAHMIVLLTGGLDLSIGVIIAMTSIVSSTVMIAAWSGQGAGIWAILAGCAAGFGAGTAIGAINGIGIAIFRVPPFMMTFAMSGIAFGIILMVTAGLPVYGLPETFANVLGYGTAGGVPIPAWITIGIVIMVYVFIDRTRMGRYLYAIGGNLRTAELSGVATRYYLFMAYVVTAALTSVAALMLTARIGGGESVIGMHYPFLTLVACLISGVSFFGGVGRVQNVVMGAMFIMLVENGLAKLGLTSYVHTIVISALLIFAVIANNYRQRLLLTIRV
jgi:ribose/xylose/arabinose/galactoside ABC-type transport system permease subunit